jgi:hypothetical protein
VKYLLCYRLLSIFHVQLGSEVTYIGWLDRVAVPRDAKHPVAGGLSDEGISTFVSFIGRYYVFDSSVARKPASDT